MALVNGGVFYKKFLDEYERKTGKIPTAAVRTEAFFCAKSGEFPSWTWW